MKDWKKMKERKRKQKLKDRKLNKEESVDLARPDRSLCYGIENITNGLDSYKSSYVYCMITWSLPYYAKHMHIVYLGRGESVCVCVCLYMCLVSWNIIIMT